MQLSIIDNSYRFGTVGKVKSNRRVCNTENSLPTSDFCVVEFNCCTMFTLHFFTYVRIERSH